MSDLFDPASELRIPALAELDGRLHGCRYIKYQRLAGVESLELNSFSQRGLQGFEAEIADVGPVVFLPSTTTAALPGRGLLIADGFRDRQQLSEGAARDELRWARPRPLKPGDLSTNEAQAICARVRKSWEGKFQYSPETRDVDGRIVQAGLRPPQIGAVHAALAHWSVSERPATIVMPTGTGKTETMLALMTEVGVERLLVVVPNAALRDQIADKFASLGILKAANALGMSAETPVVGILDSRPTTGDEVTEIFSRANVIVTTMQVAGQCEPAVQAQMATLCSHLFIDEAHHIAAKTWLAFRDKFASKRILQFTATPFRTDGKRVDGKFVYVYPLAKAQDEGFFRPIKFNAIQGLDEAEADNEIISQVGRQLSSDLAAGFDHLVMARARNINRAMSLHALYRTRLAEFNPVLIHSRMSNRDKSAALSQLRDRTSRIIVCVDMLGEGFDLPQLKISGLHDRHKSVAITLQFTGRFTRDSKGIGDATVFANIEQTDVDDALRSLYAEDADWNFLLNVLSETKTGRQLKRAEFMTGFSESLEGIPLQTLAPKMSTVVYRTDCAEWRPQEIEAAIPSATIRAGPIINEAERLAIFVTREELPTRWTNSKEINDVEWNLFLVHWEPNSKLLYINSSKSKELHEKLARAIAGGSAARVVGEAVYRVLDGLNRLMLMNLGLSSLLGRRIRYTMFVGSDITSEISDAKFTTKRKSNLFGIGYDGEGKCTIGCSAKGKFWSMKSAADFSEWVGWCHLVGAKVTDDRISTDAFIRNLVKQVQLDSRPPDKPVLAVHWPESFLIDLEERISLKFGDDEPVGFFECEIEVSNHNSDGPIQFDVVSDKRSATFEITLGPDGASYTQISGPTVRLHAGAERDLAEAFADDPPHIYFADGDFLVFNELFVVPRDAERSAFDPNRIEVRNWQNVDLTSESQGIEKKANSIQRYLIEELLRAKPDYMVVFDDDGTGEIADIVTLREQDGCLLVDLLHLKYSHHAAPGNRVADLYEVCGQAQKSIRWMEYPVRILKRIRKREGDRLAAQLPSRFERGDLSTIKNLISRWKLMDRKYQVWIVQPGLSKSGIEPKQLDLLAATENYLLDTYGVPLRVLGSA